jgi:hypothetical protein
MVARGWAVSLGRAMALNPVEEFGTEPMVGDVVVNTPSAQKHEMTTRLQECKNPLYAIAYKGVVRVVDCERGSSDCCHAPHQATALIVPSSHKKLEYSSRTCADTLATLQQRRPSLATMTAAKEKRVCTQSQT